MIVTMLFASVGCDFISDIASKFKSLFSSDEKNIHSVYEEYLAAKNAGDIEALKKLVTREKSRGLEGENAPQLLKFIQALSPSGARVTETRITGDRATLAVQSEVEAGIMKGEISLLREDGRWKISEEKWDLKIYPKPVILEGGKEAPSFEPVEAVFISPGQSYGMPVAGPFLKDRTTSDITQTTLTGHEGEVTGLAFSPDGRFIISSSYGDYTVRLWDVTDGKELQTVKLENRSIDMDVSPDWTLLLLTDAGGNITIFPVALDKLGAPQTIPAQTGHMSSISVSPNGRLFAIASFDRTVTIWSLTDRSLLRKIETPEPMRDVAFSPSGEILAASSITNKIILWNLREGKGRTYTISKVDPKSDVDRIDFSPDGKYLATAHMDSSITLWEVETQKEIHNFFVPDASTWYVRFSPDGKMLATANQDKLIHLWDTATGKAIGVLKGHAGAPRTVAFSPQGRMLASGGEDRNIIIWR